MSSQPEFPALWATPDAYTSGPADPLDGIDPSFTFDFRTYDEIGDGQRWTTWFDVEPLCRGPEPRPSWVVETRGAIDTELGILKTGKEADVFLLERADPYDPEGGVVMAAKRYRDSDHRSFHRSSVYSEGRSVKRSRDERALKRKSTWGKIVAAGEWAISEWDALKRLWLLGAAVPYPVQIDGTEILMEWITVDGETAPRLAQTRPEPELLASYYDQVRDFLALLVAERDRARRPLGVQHPGRGRAAGRHRPAADRGPGRQPERHGLPAARLHQHLRLVQGAWPRGRRAGAVRRADGARLLSRSPSCLGVLTARVRHTPVH